MHQSKRNKTCQNRFKINGGVTCAALVFHSQIWQYPDVTELFHWLTHPPQNHNCTHALSCMYKSKLNQMGERGLQNSNAVDLVILIRMAQMHHSQRNKTCQNRFKIYGGVHFTALVFHTQIWQFHDVTELFHGLTHPQRTTTVHVHCPACTKVNSIRWSRAGLKTTMQLIQ